MTEAPSRTTGFPAWAVNVDSALPVTSQFILHGNLRDRFLMPDAALLPLDLALWRCLKASGYGFLLWHTPADLRVVALDAADHQAATAAAARALGVTVEQVPRRVATEDLLPLLQRVASPGPAHGAIVLDYVSQWRPAGDPPTDAEHSLMQGALAITHRSMAFPVPDGPRGSALHNPIFWLVDRPGDLPSWLTGGDGVRQVPLPMPDLDARTAAAGRLLPLDAKDAVAEFANSTEGMSLQAMIEVTQLSRDRGLPPERITDAVRAHRVGILENPWAKPEVRGRIKAGAAALGQQVLGQDRAIGQAVDILTRSTLGLTQAYAKQRGGGPRGILFFAGPTGVGKTELAKAITRLVFGDERAYVRLDMSEFSSEHTEARLIGSPPGYVGHGAGGELTNAVRQRPFSLVLFDEIEKAHPRIMDKFLQILSDGRLTDGSGSTVHFGETIIVFTSNLGIAPLAEGQAPPTGAAHEHQVVGAISHAFTHDFNRPELLGRIGRNNIVVFDYMSPTTGRGLAARFIDTVRARVVHDAGVELTVDGDVRRRLEDLAIADLSLGGRGISYAVEEAFVNPLARALIQLPEGTRTAAVRLTEGDGCTTLTLT